MSVKDDIRAALADKFLTEFAPEYPAVTVKFENQPHDQPSTTWICFGIKFTDRMQPSIGSSREPRRQFGMIMIDIYAPVDTGSASLLQISDFIERIFDKEIIDLGSLRSVTCLISRSVPGGKQNGFYEYTVIVPFYCDSCN